MRTKFLTSWTDEQLKSAKKIINKYLESRFFESLHSGENSGCFCGRKSYSQKDEVLGLAYTSCGIYAGLFACNTKMYLDTERRFYLHSFAMEQGGFVYAIFQDCNETEIIFPIN